MVTGVLCMKQKECMVHQLPLSIGMVEHAQVNGCLGRMGEVNFGQPMLYLFNKRWEEPGAGHDFAERVNVVGNRNTVEQRRLNGGGTPSAKGIVDPLSRLGEVLNEKARQLWFEASPVGNLMQRVSLALLGGPELAGVARYCFLTNSNAICK